MILDGIKNLGRYAPLHTLLPNASHFLSGLNKGTFPFEGKVVIMGDDLYANFQELHGITRQEAVLETHNSMIDIHIVLDHEEEIGWKPRGELPIADYDFEKDFSIYPGIKPSQYVRLRPGYFAIFFPQDAHAPCISSSETYHKVVLKLKK